MTRPTTLVLANDPVPVKKSSEQEYDVFSVEFRITARTFDVDSTVSGDMGEPVPIPTLPVMLAPLESVKLP
jgi:hypothetical protein